MNDPIFLTKVVLSNYKSIKQCSVKLGALTFLVGQNGAGKSNFLDALRLVSDSLNTSLEHALRDRGGISEVRRRSSGHPTHFGIRLEWRLPHGKQGVYAFRVGAQKKGGFEVQQEACRIFAEDPRKDNYYLIENGQLVESSLNPAPPVVSDRLYLVPVGGLPEFRPLYDALAHMGFYNLNPDKIRELQPPDPGEVLKRDGSNLASVLSVMGRDTDNSRTLHQQIVEFLSKVVPGIQNIEIRHIGKKETLEFRQCVGTNKDPWRFMAENMSDGTLRALGVLTALFQSGPSGAKKVRFVGIEEPEVAVHPGAAGVLRDGLWLAAENTQTIVTSHSPDLLDDKRIEGDNILAVVNHNGDTIIGPIDSAGRSAMKDRLYTAGELLRLNQLEHDPVTSEQISIQDCDLFGDMRR